MSTKQRTRSAVNSFSSGLRTFAQQLTDGVQQLKRTTDIGPCAGAREFKDVLQDLEEEVSDMANEVQHLERFSVDMISFEELLGHCAAMYQSNRQVTLNLEAHLKQYGYEAQQPLQQPTDPMVMMASLAAGEALQEGDDTGEDDDADQDGADGGMAATGHDVKFAPTPHRGASSAAIRQKLAARMQTPAVKGFADLDDDEDEDDGDDTDIPLDKGAPAQGYNTPKPKASQPGSTTHIDVTNRAATTTAVVGAKGHHSQAAAGPSIKHMPTAQSSAKKPHRDSMDSRASSTPDMFMLSPSFAALQAKYATESGSKAGVPSCERCSSPEMCESPRLPGMDEVRMSPVAGLLDIRLQQLALSSADEEHTLPRASASAVPRQQAPWAGTASSSESAGPTKQPSLQFPSGLAAPSSSSYNPSDEDTCSLYHQLIRSKDVPSSLTSMAKAKAPIVPKLVLPGTVGASSARPVSPAIPPRASISVVQKSAPGEDGQQKEEQNAQLATKLASLQNLWVESGQAALTPRRAAKADMASPGPSAGRPRAVPASSPSFRIPMAGTSQHGRQLASQPGQTARAPAVPGASVRAASILSKSTPTWPLSGALSTGGAGSTGGRSGNLVETPALDASLLAKYPSGSPATSGSSTHSLSPGTSQLISRVFGSSSVVEHIRPQPNMRASIQVLSFSNPELPAAAQQPPLPCSVSQAPSVSSITQEEYGGLPSFLRSQLPLEQFNVAIIAMNQVLVQRSSTADLGMSIDTNAMATLTMEDLEKLGYGSQKGKVLVNCLVKLNRIEMQGSQRFVVKSQL